MTRETIKRSLIVAAALAAVAPAPADAQGTRPLTVGLLRADGFALPFAHWGGVEWTTLRSDSLPIDVHYVDRWYLSTGNGFRPLTAGSMVSFMDGDNFYEGWGQLTDFSPRRFEPRSYPRPRVGVVLSRPERLIHLRSVGRSDPLRAQISRLIRAELDRQDSATVQRFMTGSTLSARERTRLPVRLAKLEASHERVSGERIYLYVAERDYPGCETGALQGFALEKNGALRLVSPQFELSDCEGKGRARLTIEAILPLPEGVFLLGEESGWESATRVVLEMTPSGIRRVVPRR
ncbi:MAG: hypothetical protein ABR499_05195 [Gemmatimonadaceae bacterium]